VRSIIPRIENLKGLALLKEGILDLLFPRRCVFCGLSRQGGGPCLCSPCQEALHILSQPWCGICGYPAEIDYTVPEENFFCARCRLQAPPFDRARSIVLYESAFKGLMAFYKYQGQPGALNEIRPLLQDYFLNHAEDYCDLIVVPVPLHHSKCRSRGFDQAVLLAREVSEVFNLPLAAGVMTRVRATETQTRMSRKKRIENMRGAFAVCDVSLVEDRRVLVVDDVMTTGATVGEVSRVLKKNGARWVEVLTLGRAP